MPLKLISGPGIEPLTVDEAKLHMREDSAVEDSLIAVWIEAARQECENECARALITQTWERVLDADEIPGYEIPLWPSVQSITSVTYIDGNGDSQVLDSSLYTLDADRLPGWALPAYGQSWPSTLQTANAMRIRFVAGYGATAASVPASLRAWIALRVATLHKFREQIAAGVSIAELPRGFSSMLLDPHRTYC